MVFKDNTAIGWCITGLYFISALYITRKILITRKRFTNRKDQRVNYFTWFLVIACLLFLGINKQLDFQSTLIAYGRVFTNTYGLSEFKRQIQLGFIIFLLLNCFIASIFIFRSKNIFFSDLKYLYLGLTILLSYIIIRAITINHADDFFGWTLYKLSYVWILELLGLLIILLATKNFFNHKSTI